MKDAFSRSLSPCNIHCICYKKKGNLSLFHPYFSQMHVYLDIMRKNTINCQSVRNTKYFFLFCFSSALDLTVDHVLFLCRVKEIV